MVMGWWGGDKKQHSNKNVLSLYHGSHMDVPYSFSFSLHSEDRIAKIC